jgi:hypothetical protein
MPQLTEDQAYLAMFHFLSAKYRLGGLDDLGWLLGSMSLLSDGSTADPAFAEDWRVAVAAALTGDVDAAQVIKNEPER